VHADVPQEVVQAHFNKRQVRIGAPPPSSVLYRSFYQLPCLVQLVIPCHESWIIVFLPRELLVSCVDYCSSGELQCSFFHAHAIATFVLLSHIPTCYCHYQRKDCRTRLILRTRI
jgi:hypothetical protein